VAAAGTDSTIVLRIAARLAGLGAEPTDEAPAVLAEAIRADAARFAEVAHRYGIRRPADPRRGSLPPGRRRGRLRTRFRADRHRAPRPELRDREHWWRGFPHQHAGRAARPAAGHTQLIANDTLVAVDAVPAPGIAPMLPALAPVLLGVSAPQVVVTHPRSGIADAAAYAAHLCAAGRPPIEVIRRVRAHRDEASWLTPR